MRKTATVQTLAALLLATILTGCSIRQAAFNSVSDMLAPPPSPPSARAKADGVDPMIALTGENDPELVRDFFPTALKLYEIMHLQNPDHYGLAVMTGQLYVTYANAFVQTPAEQLPSDRYSEQNEAYLRAGNFYVRGRDYALDGLDRTYRGFRISLFGPDQDRRAAALARCRAADAAALYWAGAGALGAFSLDPMNSDLLAFVPGSLAMLERAAVLDPAFGDGAIFEILASFYASAPEGLGGNREKARAAWEEALRLSGGKSPSVYILYARTFCIPSQDSAGFDEAIAEALAIDPDSRPSTRLASVIAQRQARWLAEHKADYILE